MLVWNRGFLWGIYVVLVCPNGELPAQLGVFCTLSKRNLGTVWCHEEVSSGRAVLGAKENLTARPGAHLYPVDVRARAVVGEIPIRNIIAIDYQRATTLAARGSHKAALGIVDVNSLIVGTLDHNGVAVDDNGHLW